MTDDDIAGHVLELTQRIAATHDTRRELWPDRVRRNRRRWATCLACGCLCLLDECCPVCLATRGAAA